MFSFRKKIFSLMLISVFCFVGCTNSSEYYVKGLINLESQQNDKAVKSFEKAIKKGSDVEVLLSLKELEKLQISSNKMLKLTKVAVKANKNPEQETYCFYLQSLLNNKKYDKVIKVASTLPDIQEHKDWKNYCYATAILAKEKSLKNVFIQDWLTQESFSKYHSKFAEDFFISELFSNSENSNLIALMEFRNLLYYKNYNASLEKLSSIVLSFDEIVNFSPIVISDIGKLFLYVSSEKLFSIFGLSKVEVAKKLQTMSETCNDKDKSFYLSFYAGRIFDKTGSENYIFAKRSFLSAVENSTSDKNYDNALWYYLNQLKKDSIKSLIWGIEQYGTSWKDKSYYSDLLNDVKLELLSTRQWTLFTNLYPTIQKIADEEVKSIWGYLTARLVKNDFVSSLKFNLDVENIFLDVLENEYSPLYYKIMSAWQLQIAPYEILESMYQPSSFTSPDENKTNSICNLFSSCVKFGKIQKFYEILQQYKKYLSSDILKFYAKEIYKNFGSDKNLYPVILRIASSAFSTDGNGKDLELLQLFYPRFFYDLVQTYASEYNLSETVLLGLIRSESYFDEDVFSRVGAMGLTQLMPSTASDVARKLRIQDYDLLDAKTNINFGSFYLNELIRRLDGSTMLAVISYNTGITRIRNWVKKYSNVPMDIWIEMLPYQESREYGKKILSSAFMYGILYYNENSYQIVKNFME